MSYEQTLKSVDDILRTDAGCATPIDYIEQTSWILFLKYLSDLEKELLGDLATARNIFLNFQKVLYSN